MFPFLWSSNKANKCRLQVLAIVSRGHADNGSLVHILNDEKARLLSPCVVNISLMMVLGMFDNAFVCFYYTLKEKKSTNTFFVVVLSVFDLLTCLMIHRNSHYSTLLYISGQFCMQNVEVR